MLKVLKYVLLALGVVLVVAAGVVMVWDVIQINQLVTVANANQSDQAALNENPRLWIILAAVGVLVGGFALGAAVAMPGRTFKQRVAEESKPLAPVTTPGIDPGETRVFTPPIPPAPQPIIPFNDSPTTAFGAPEPLPSERAIMDPAPPTPDPEQPFTELPPGTVVLTDDQAFWPDTDQMIASDDPTPPSDDDPLIKSA